MKKDKFSITGMTCAACQANITKRVSKLDGVQDVNVSLLSNQMSVEYDESVLQSSAITAAVSEIGYGAALLGGKRETRGLQGEWQSRRRSADDERGEMKKRLTYSVILLIALMYVSMGGMLGLPLPAFLSGNENLLALAFTQLLIAIPVIFINRKFFTVGFKALIKRAPNMDSLVAIGSAAALVYGIFAMYRMIHGLAWGDAALVHQYGHELYFESSAMILTLVTVGKYLEARSKAKTTEALDKLAELAPKTANVIRNGEEVTVAVEALAAGDILVIRPGDSIPADGEVVDGHGYVDQAAITGESIPVEKAVGDAVISATINKNGAFRMRASKVGDDTTLAQIIRLVDEAGNSKAPIARLADRVSGVFVPVVICVAIITVAAWLLAGQGFEFALSCGITVLVISCPCALGLATPVAIMAGTGKAAEKGILIKSAASLENLHSITAVVLDKTGTITAGMPRVAQIVTLGDMGENELVAFAAAVEAGSEHPLAAAIQQEAHERGIAAAQADKFEATAGRGVRAKLGGHVAIAGNLAFLQECGALGDRAGEVRGLVEALANEGGTPLIFAKDSVPVGVISVADAIREDSAEAIRRLKRAGLRVIMLTGDNGVTAEAVRRKLGLDEAISDVLPAQKEAVIRDLQRQGCKVAMVGDGINDAPALIRADIGIAIGAGADIAIDSADIVLMRDSLMDVVTAVKLGRAVVRNIRMNLFWAFFYNILGIPLAAGVFFTSLGIKLSPMIGAAAMSLSSVCVVTNALRLRFFKFEGEPSTSAPKPEPETKISGDAPQSMKGNNNMKKVINVEGMMCGHCKMHVEKALLAVEGVASANANLESNTATVELTAEVDDKALIDAINDAGYKASI